MSDKPARVRVIVCRDDRILMVQTSGTIEEQGVVDLIQMFVEPAARRSRLGTMLSEAIIGWARERGARRVRLTVNTADRGAPALYRSLGFTDTGRRETDRFEGRAGDGDGEGPPVGRL